MEPLSVGFIGWFFTIVSAGVLVLGAAIIFWLYRAGTLGPRYLEGHIWSDALLLAIWMLGLAGGIGVLARESWGRFLVEMFCWVLIALTLLSAMTRLLAQRQEQPGRHRAGWVSAISAALVVVLPVVAVCAATLMTLHSDAAWHAFVTSR